jgi:hypothetical protein
MKNEECSNLEAWLRIVGLIFVLGWLLPWACEVGEENRLDDEERALMHWDNQQHRDRNR